MPRPTRTRPCRAPLLSRIWFSFIVALAFALIAQPLRGRFGLGRFFDSNEVLHLADLAEHLRGALHFHAAVQLVQAQADERRALGLVAADRRTGLRDLDLGHHSYSVTASA